jgi:P-type E1-E2 ATPase
MRSKLFKSLLKDLGPIVFRNIFSLVVIIIGGLSLVLIVLGDLRDGIFLGSVITVNIIIGIIQELRAKYKLEKLQLSTKQKYEVLRDDKPRLVFAEDIAVGDIINLKLGDQIPVDSKIIEADSFECNFALLTGESENVTKKPTDKLISGGIVVAGNALIKATAKEKDSYLYKMNLNLKKYETSYSPIQKDILRFIKLMAFILLILGLIIITRSVILEGSILRGFVQVAALASTIIAEGLLLASTLLFAYGAIKMAGQKVLLQQINAIENLGRVSVVCVDKTGTITESNPVYENSILYSPKDKSYFEKIISSLISRKY